MLTLVLFLDGNLKSRKMKQLKSMMLLIIAFATITSCEYLDDTLVVDLVKKINP